MPQVAVAFIRAYLMRDTKSSVPLDAMGFPGYIALKNGTVLSVKRSVKPIILSSYPHEKSGRLMVQMWRDGRMRGMALARLILNAFGRSPPKGRGFEPVHRNGDTTDCRLSNLRWGRKAAPDRERVIKMIRGLMRRYDITADDLAAKIIPARATRRTGPRQRRAPVLTDPVTTEASDERYETRPRPTEVQTEGREGTQVVGDGRGDRPPRT